jgi:hypothetical protein
MSMPEVDPEDVRSETFAAGGLYPNRSPCPVGCKFCYERSLPEFYPNLKVAIVRPKTLKQFDFFTEQLEKYKQSAVPSGPVMLEPDGMVTYHSASDFFAQGLSLEQLDRIVAANSAAGQAPYVSTMGKGFDFETAKFLQDKHPDAFRVRLSLLTYNDAIKADMIPRWENSDDMRKITSILRDALVYLLHFNQEQTLSDLREVNRLANLAHKPKVGIAVVHYTRKHSTKVQEYAKSGFGDFEALIRHLMTGKESLDNIDEISFQHPAEAFTFRFRNFLRAKLAPWLLGEDDLVLTSRGAYGVMSELVVRTGATVRAVRDNLGGSTSFTTTLCTNDFLRDLGEILAEPDARSWKRVFVPAPVWWVGGDTTCLNGGTIDDLRRAFPTLEFIPVDVPMDILESRLSTREAYDWYNVDLARTRALALHEQSALTPCLAAYESLTETGFVRRIVIEGKDDVAIDPKDLASIDPKARVMVVYDELLVEREALYPPEGDDERFTLDVNGEEVFVRRSFARRYALEGPYMRSLFEALFVAKRPFGEVAQAALGDLPARMYQQVADLERRGFVSRAKRRLPLCG